MKKLNSGSDKWILVWLMLGSALIAAALEIPKPPTPPAVTTIAPPPKNWSQAFPPGPQTFVYTFPRATNDRANGLLVAWDTKAQRRLTNYAQIESAPTPDGPWLLLGTTNRSPFTFTSSASSLFLRCTPTGVWQ